MGNNQGKNEQRSAVKNGNHVATVHWYQWLKWGDFLMYALIGGLAIVLLLAMPGGLIAGKSTAGAILVQDNQIILQLDQKTLAGQGERTLTANGYHYKMIWSAGKIRFSEADCPDKICVQTGWISYWGEIAACVPGHLILKIKGGTDGQTTETGEVDVILK